MHHIRDRRREGAAIYAIWHGNMAIPVYAMRNRGVYALVSPVWLGEIIAGIVDKLGFHFIRASSNYKTTKGIRDLVRILRAEHDLAIMLDGPSGPARQVNAGIVNIASITGKPIILGYGACTKSFHLPTWDRNEWPLPFTTVVFAASEPLFIPPRLDAEARAHEKTRIQERLFLLQQEAESYLVTLI